MKNHKHSSKRLLLAGCIAASIFMSCNKEDDSTDSTTTTPTSETDKLNLNDYQNGSAVMMQAFYWDVEPIGEWYNEIGKKINDWATNGVDRIWLPPPSKGQSGKYSMGYDPSDYFDLGEFDQHGTVKTRFGSRQELESLITKAHNLNLEVIADIVISHNSGGGKQDNPNRPGDTEVYTLFNEENGNASGKFNRDFNHFHPNEQYQDDGFEPNPFYAKTDLSHNIPYVQDWLWADETKSVASFYQGIGFDGWRFDYVKSFDPKYVKAWNAKTAGLFSVGENFDGNSAVIEQWVEASGSAAFDFACFYKLDEALDRHQDLTYLDRDMLRKSNPDKAVTFVSNHDTEKDSNADNRVSFGNKLLAYAYILTHDGYPTLFYSDYENASFKPAIQKLVALHNSLATGAITVLEISKDHYIMKREGTASNPGLILFMNVSNRAASLDVSTGWNNKTLLDYSENSDLKPITDASGNATLTAPAKNYTIWSVTK